MTYALWIVQGLLAALFLFGGTVKLAMPIEELTAQVPVPGLFIQFISVAEILGAFGLVLPALLRTRPGLTPLAAAGLAIIMAGATALGLASGDVAATLFPLATGLFALFVAYGRWRPAPIRQSSRPAALQTTS